MVASARSYLTVLTGAIYPSMLVEKQWQHLVYPWWDKVFDFLEDSGNLHILATKPDTIGKRDFLSKIILDHKEKESRNGWEAC